MTFSMEKVMLTFTALKCRIVIFCVENQDVVLFLLLRDILVA